MKRNFLLSALLLLFVGFSQAQELRPPSVPLIAHDPYFSVWSPADHLYDSETNHWTGKPQPLHSMIRVDGKTYKIMGYEPGNMEPLRQKSLKVYPTRTVYQFENAIVSLELTFTTPALVSNLDVLSRPVTYINWSIKALDNKEHDIQVFFDCGAEIAVNTTDQDVQWSTPAIQGLNAIQLGSQEQSVLKKAGDDIRIDWGFAYLAIPEGQKGQVSVSRRRDLLRSFISKGEITSAEKLSQPRRVNDGDVTMGTSWNLGKVGNTAVSSLVMMAYDDISSIQYFDTPLKAWWKRNGMTIEQLLPLALNDYAKLSVECEKFDLELMADLNTVGGPKYAEICALAYRQCFAAHKLTADANGKPLIFSKENFSNGCIATVDVIYPAAPIFFFLSPELTKAMLQPNFDYAASAKWKFPFAPHDIGTYPHATGQVYGGGEDDETDQMPVEETGNMVIMTAVLAKMEGNANYAEANWPILEKWCEFLLSKGFDPENQLCTDDFAGHLAHNINLSAKAIVALGSYSMLCEMTGRKEKAIEVRQKAEVMAKEWIKLATEGDHTKLAFDQPNTWSQKYNLVWDKLLGLNLFPNEVIQKEIEFYKTKQGAFGLPLDSRERYTKNDWITWSATMADTKQDFQTLFDPIYDYANKTTRRVPLCDWYNTDNAYMVGFQARSVVGGFFIKMLDDKKVWTKWINKGTNVSSGKWAPLKFLKLGKEILPNASTLPSEWKYTTEKPSENWFANEFQDTSWKTGTAGFGSRSIRFTKTVWETSDIWIRKSFDVKSVSSKKLALTIFHDEDAVIYINGVLIDTLMGFTGKYASVILEKKVNEVLHKGINTIAIQCHQTTGGQFIDAGLSEY